MMWYLKEVNIIDKIRGKFFASVKQDNKANRLIAASQSGMEDCVPMH